MDTRLPRALVAPLLLLIAIPSCSSIYYSAMELMGKAKRDLLVGRVKEARESQTEAKEQIQTTFEAFKSLTNFDGGELETRYNTLKAEFDRAKKAAGSVSKRIKSIEDVSEAIFAEWTKEREEIQNPEQKRRSEELQFRAEQDYAKMLGAMKAAESRMPPVLTAFQDQVLFLKHSLNARAISSLEGEVLSIQSNVDQLIEEMQRSIDEANAFIAENEPSS